MVITSAVMTISKFLAIPGVGWGRGGGVCDLI